MSRLSYLFFLTVFLISCAGNKFDEATIPADQLSTEMAFRRVAEHGGMEAVIEDSQAIKEWQFHISSSSRIVVLNADPEFTYWLKDRSGIEYRVSSTSTPLAIIEQMKGTSYGYGSGEVLSVDRDLVAGEITAELKLASWREREQ